MGMFLTTAHELGHLCNGVHSDCQSKNLPTASVMCQGTKKNPPYFSQASVARIGHPMDLVSTSGASATFKTGRDGTSYATIKTAGGTSMSGSVYVGKPVITIEGPNRTPNTGYAKYRAIYDERCSPTKFEWILNPKGNNSVYGTNTSTVLWKYRPSV